jgi:hypothetical protein
VPLRLAIAVALALSGLKLLDVPHANLLIVVGLGVGFGVLAAWGIWRLRSKTLVEGDGAGAHLVYREAAASTVESGDAERRGQARLGEQSLEGAREG